MSLLFQHVKVLCLILQKIVTFQPLQMGFCGTAVLSNYSKVSVDIYFFFSVEYNMTHTLVGDRVLHYMLDRLFLLGEGLHKFEVTTCVASPD